MYSSAHLGLSFSTRSRDRLLALGVQTVASEEVPAGDR